MFATHISVGSPLCEKAETRRDNAVELLLSPKRAQLGRGPLYHVHDLAHTSAAILVLDTSLSLNRRGSRVSPLPPHPPFSMNPTLLHPIPPYSTILNIILHNSHHPLTITTSPDPTPTVTHPRFIPPSPTFPSRPSHR